MWLYPIRQRWLEYLNLSCKNILLSEDPVGLVIRRLRVQDAQTTYSIRQTRLCIVRPLLECPAWASGAWTDHSIECSSPSWSHVYLNNFRRTLSFPQNTHRTSMNDRTRCSATGTWCKNIQGRVVFVSTTLDLPLTCMEESVHTFEAIRKQRRDSPTMQEANLSPIQTIHRTVCTTRATMKTESQM